MKRLLLFLLFFLFVGFAYSGDVSVRGYLRSDGTYVQPHMRSSPDGNFYNNWSTKGNINPYTGVPGTRVTPPVYGTGGSSPICISNDPPTTQGQVLEFQNLTKPENASLRDTGVGFESFSQLYQMRQAAEQAARMRQ